MQKRTEIIIETERLLVVTRRPAKRPAASRTDVSAVDDQQDAPATTALNQYRRPERASLWCPRCRRPVLMMTPSEAARTENAGALAISELAEAGLLHFTVTPAGQLFICSNSLRAVREETANHIDKK